MHYVYVIFSETADQYHIGLAKDVQIALWQHNAKANPATAAGKPWVIRFKQGFEKRPAAQSLEMKLKNKDRLGLEEFLNNQN
ncbi:GIY-YIG nuclease family protein [Tellurirhabdus rosea]|uniref:GIY-YIG nuclease family protein n=1 Tax=Tellurirhabdus rosea TaxID=2674997 RepID=UPI00224DF40C|nr:GIY-YIG nuclease family protein [Tellurirhabdus rosea]